MKKLHPKKNVLYALSNARLDSQKYRRKIGLLSGLSGHSRGSLFFVVHLGRMMKRNHDQDIYQRLTLYSQKIKSMVKTFDSLSLSREGGIEIAEKVMKQLSSGKYNPFEGLQSNKMNNSGIRVIVESLIPSDIKNINQTVIDISRILNSKLSVSLFKRGGLRSQNDIEFSLPSVKYGMNQCVLRLKFHDWDELYPAIIQSIIDMILDGVVSGDSGRLQNLIIEGNFKRENNRFIRNSFEERMETLAQNPFYDSDYSVRIATSPPIITATPSTTSTTSTTFP